MSPKSRARRPNSPRRPARRVREEAPTGRYTPPERHLRFRPTWHKAVGGVSIVAGALLYLLCQFNVWHLHDYGGHIWYLVGFAIAASSLWWFGAFDPP